MTEPNKENTAKVIVMAPLLVALLSLVIGCLLNFYLDPSLSDRVFLDFSRLRFCGSSYFHEHHVGHNLLSFFFLRATKNFYLAKYLVFQLFFSFYLLTYWLAIYLVLEKKILWSIFYLLTFSTAPPVLMNILRQENDMVAWSIFLLAFIFFVSSFRKLSWPVFGVILGVFVFLYSTSVVLFALLFFLPIDYFWGKKELILKKLSLFLFAGFTNFLLRFVLIEEWSQYASWAKPFLLLVGMGGGSPNFPGDLAPLGVFSWDYWKIFFETYSDSLFWFLGKGWDPLIWLLFFGSALGFVCWSLFEIAKRKKSSPISYFLLQFLAITLALGFLYEPNQISKQDLFLIFLLLLLIARVKNFSIYVRVAFLGVCLIYSIENFVKMIEVDPTYHWYGVKRARRGNDQIAIELEDDKKFWKRMNVFKAEMKTGKAKFKSLVLPGDLVEIDFIVKSWNIDLFNQVFYKVPCEKGMREEACFLHIKSVCNKLKMEAPFMGIGHTARDFPGSVIDEKQFLDRALKPIYYLEQE